MAINDDNSKLETRSLLGGQPTSWWEKFKTKWSGTPKKIKQRAFVLAGTMIVSLIVFQVIIPYGFPVYGSFLAIAVPLLSISLGALLVYAFAALALVVAVGFIFRVWRQDISDIPLFTRPTSASSNVSLRTQHQDQENEFRSPEESEQEHSRHEEENTGTNQNGASEVKEEVENAPNLLGPSNLTQQTSSHAQLLEEIKSRLTPDKPNTPSSFKENKTTSNEPAKLDLSLLQKQLEPTPVIDAGFAPPLGSNQEDEKNEKNETTEPELLSFPQNESTPSSTFTPVTSILLESNRPNEKNELEDKEIGRFSSEQQMEKQANDPEFTLSQSSEVNQSIPESSQYTNFSDSQEQWLQSDVFNPHVYPQLQDLENWDIQKSGIFDFSHLPTQTISSAHISSGDISKSISASLYQSFTATTGGASSTQLPSEIISLEKDQISAFLYESLTLEEVSSDEEADSDNNQDLLSSQLNNADLDALNQTSQVQDQHALSASLYQSSTVKTNSTSLHEEKAKHIDHHVLAKEKQQAFINMGRFLIKSLCDAAPEDACSKKFNASQPSLPKWLEEISKEVDLVQFVGLADKDTRINISQEKVSLFRTCASQINIVSTAALSLKRTLFPVEASHRKNRQIYLAAVLCMMWAIYKEAADQGDDFSRGSYKIVDEKQQRLFECLRDYVAFVARTATPENVSPYGVSILDTTQRVATGNISSFFSNHGHAISTFAYSRDPQLKLSSHYLGNRQQYGIDLRFEENEFSLPLFPFKSTHLLFGAVDCQGQQVTFLKFEPEGLGEPTEAVAHGLSFMNSHHATGQSRREKDVPPTLYAAYEDFCMAVGTKSVAIKKATVHQMHNYMFVESVDGSTLEAAEAAKEAFLKAAKELNYAENLALRTGNESILALEPIKAKSDANLETIAPKPKPLQEEDGFLLLEFSTSFVN